MPMRAFVCLILMAGTAPQNSAAQQVKTPEQIMREAAAEQGFIGALGDYMHRLSGPGFVGGDLDLTCFFWTCKSLFKKVASQRYATDDRWHPKASIGGYWSRHDDVSNVPDDTANIAMITLEVGAEADPFHYKNFPLRVGGGITLHYFDGEAKPFVNYSIPLWAYYRPPWFHLGPVRLKAGVRTRVFFPFGDSAFKPFKFKEMKRHQMEGILTYLLAFEIRP